MIGNFSIAGQVVQVADGSFCRLLSGFETDSPAGADLPACCIESVGGQTQFGIVSLTPEGWTPAHVFQAAGDGRAVLMTSGDYARAALYAPGRGDMTVKELLLTAVYSRLVQYGALLAHASLVDVPGRGGILFVGRSGIGKTTQATLWEQYRQAVILNGDKVFLTMGEGGVLAHGNPWNGSSPYKVNGCTYLRGIIALDQATTNTIRPVSSMEVMSLYVPHIFLPVWDAQLTGAAMETLGQMLPLVPVYAMSCRPDEEAVALAERTVFAGDR
jgi:hypothetical protein